MSSAELIKKLIADGWVKQRQTGSHVTLTKPGIEKIITIPHPRRILQRGLLDRLNRYQDLN
jgi:predicted RNA binding protein YcfA (HicA-like mRNA interferase family)